MNKVSLKLGNWREVLSFLELSDKQVEDLNNVLSIQGREGNYDYDDYMLGMYNGMELMDSIVDNRNPNFRRLSWQDQRAPYISNQSEIEYWDNYIDADPWTDDSKDVEDLVMSAEIILKKYVENEDARENDIQQMKTNFYYKVLPLAISYLKIKGKINIGVIEAMIMQNL